jgi:putative transposase
VVTSNHIYLLVKDKKQHAIAKSLQLIEGRNALEYNLRTQRKGAFWEDRYHATAIESDEHFLRCLVYIDIPALMDLGGFNDIATMQQQLRQWLIEELKINNSVRDKTWSESLAVGSEDFLDKVKTLLNPRATNREVTEMAGKHALREQFSALQ